MTPSSAFGRPELNAFLFASVGEDKNGIELTVLSALLRLGFDPWQEAARLSELPREAAARTLAAAFALLPEGNWQVPQMASLAVRLVDYLPRPGALPSAVFTRGKRGGKVTWRPTRWLFWLAVAVGWFFLLSYLTPNSTYESTPTVSTRK
jgi:hypothetical protein